MDMQLLAYIFFIGLLVIAFIVGLRLQKHENGRLEK